MPFFFSDLGLAPLPETLTPHFEAATANLCRNLQEKLENLYHLPAAEDIQTCVVGDVAATLADNSSDRDIYVVRTTAGAVAERSTYVIVSNLLLAQAFINASEEGSAVSELDIADEALNCELIDRARSLAPTMWNIFTEPAALQN